MESMHFFIKVLMLDKFCYIYCTYSVSNSSSLISASKYSIPTCQDIKKAQIIQLFANENDNLVTLHIYSGPLKYWKSEPKCELTQDIKHSSFSLKWGTLRDWKQKPNLITANTIYSENWNLAVILTRCVKMVQLNRKYTNAQFSIFKTNKRILSLFEVQYVLESMFFQKFKIL